MAVEIVTEGEVWTIPPRSAKESAYRITHRADGRWVAQATTHERYTTGGDWFSPFVSALTAQEACMTLVRRMATQIKDKAYLHEVAHAITRATGAPPPDDGE